jgi:hypothetical protein
MMPEPADGLGDGTAVTPITISVDVTTLSQHDASEYRHELFNAIYYPGTEFDMSGGQGASDLKAYCDKLAEVDTYLATFPEKI